MAIYGYKAIDATHLLSKGVLSAENPRQARDILRAQGLEVRDLRPRVSDQSTRAFQGAFARHHVAKVVSFIRELATLLGVGIPLVEAIETVSRQYKGSFHDSLLALRERVSAGASLAEAMRDQPALFDEMCVNITEVGENAGTLDSALEQFADFKERTLSLKSRITTALAYPAVVLVMAIGVSILMMTLVVPNLLSALLDAGRPLPWPTVIVKGASDLLIEWWWLLMIGVVAAIATVTAALRTATGQAFWHRQQLRLPLVGDLIRKQAVVRIAVVMTALLRSGVVFVRAIQIARKSTRNVVLRDALLRCETAVTSGRNIGEALADTQAFPAAVVQIFSVGQQSGRLEEMLDRLAKDYDRQLATAAQRLTAFLEPLLILVMVTLVGFIAFATILPMLEAADAF